MWLNRKQLVLFLWCRTELYPLLKAVTDTSHFFVPKICILTPVCQIAVGLKLVWCGSTGNTLCFFVLQIYHCHLCLCARMCVCVWCLGGCMCVCMCVHASVWEFVCRLFRPGVVWASTLVCSPQIMSLSSLHGRPKVTEMNSYECMS